MIINKLKFIDLFAGLGGIRLGFEQACNEMGIETECVLKLRLLWWQQIWLKSWFPMEKA